MHKDICVGLISKPIGIKGQVKVISYTEVPCSLFEYNNLFLLKNIKIHFKNIKLIKDNNFIVSIDGVNDRNEAEKYRLKNIYINNGDLHKLDNNEYYYNDLLNSQVFDNNNNLLGTIKAVLNYGAGDFLEIKLLNNKEATMPFNKNAILEVNLGNNCIVVDEKYLLV